MLIEAIENKDYLLVKKALKNGENPNSKTIEDEIPVFLYALYKKVPFEILELLIQFGANPQETDNDGVGALDYAIKFADKKTIEYIFDLFKPDLNSTKRKSGMLPLMVASSYGLVEIVEFLIKNGANIETKDRSKMSALDYAKKLRQDKVVKFLESL